MTNEKEELKWKIVGDVIGYQMRTKEIVEMYAEEYGYTRHGGLAQGADKESYCIRICPKCHKEYESPSFSTTCCPECWKLSPPPANVPSELEIMTAIRNSYKNRDGAISDKDTLAIAKEIHRLCKGEESSQ